MEKAKSNRIVQFLIGCLIVTGLLISAEKGYAQKVRYAAYFEKTSVSPKAGSMMAVVFSNDFEIGGFYQNEIRYGDVEKLQSKREREFWGLYFGIPVLRSEMITISGRVRTGFVNQQYYTITPAVFTEFHPVKFISIGLGMGVRNLTPTYMPVVSIKI